jgi:hypothetical protein
MQTKSRSPRFGMIDKQRCFLPRNRAPDVNWRVFSMSVIEQWRDRRNVSRGFLWKRSPCREVLFIPLWTCVMGCKEACRSETVVHVFEVSGARDDVVVNVKWVGAETIANAEFDPGAWHELHQPHGTARRNRVLVPATLSPHHSTDPTRRDGEATGRLVDEFGEPIDRFRTLQFVHALDSSNAGPATLHIHSAMATMTSISARSVPGRAIGFAIAGVWHFPCGSSAGSSIGEHGREGRIGAGLGDWPPTVRA